MRFDSPSTWNAKEVSGDLTLTPHDCLNFGWFHIASGGTLTLPSPSNELKGVEIIVVNGTSGAETISCANGFPNNLDSASLPAGQSAMLVCGPAVGGSLKWAAIGATAA